MAGLMKMLVGRCCPVGCSTPQTPVNWPTASPHCCQKGEVRASFSLQIVRLADSGRKLARRVCCGLVTSGRPQCLNPSHQMLSTCLSSLHHKLVVSAKGWQLASEPTMSHRDTKKCLMLTNSSSATN